MSKLTRAEHIVSIQRDRVRAAIKSMRPDQDGVFSHGVSFTRASFNKIWNDYRGAFGYLRSVRGES